MVNGPGLNCRSFVCAEKRGNWPIMATFGEGLYILVLPKLKVGRRSFGTLVSILEPFLSLSLTHIGWDCILVRLRDI